MAVNRFGFYLGPVFFRKYLNTHNVHFDRSGFLEDNYLNMAECLTKDKIQILNKTDRKREKASKKRYIAINNTCSDLAFVRKLPDSIMWEICLWLLNHTSYHIAWLGGPEDTIAVRLFLERQPEFLPYQERISNYAGKFEFADYYKFLQQDCELLITIDSGPLHIAKALGVPTVSVWGPTNPSNYLKIGPEELGQHVYYYSQAPCSPCVHFKNTLPCGGDNFCMKEIETRKITDTIERLLLSLQEG
jgi:ADP-heptose:LPS heptosyltransferase